MAQCHLYPGGMDDHSNILNLDGAKLREEAAAAYHRETNQLRVALVKANANRTLVL